MAVSCPAFGQFLGAYLHEDNELTIHEVITLYIKENPDGWIKLVHEIENLEDSPVSISMKEQIAIEMMEGLSPHIYPLSDKSTSSYQWLLDLKKEILKQTCQV